MVFRQSQNTFSAKIWPLILWFFQLVQDFWDFLGHPKGPTAKDFPKLYCIPRIPHADPRSTLQPAAARTKKSYCCAVIIS